jgi:hypothetical protein
MTVKSVKVILPPWKYFWTESFKYNIDDYLGIMASDSIFSGMIVSTLFFIFLIISDVLSFNLSEELRDRFEEFGKINFKLMSEFFKSFSKI